MDKSVTGPTLAGAQASPESPRASAAAQRPRALASPALSVGWRRAILALTVGLLIATGVFAAGRVIWRIINTDGGWYSYPGYALAQGRDADENLLPPNELPLGSPGVRSLFPWENRSLLLTRIDWAWFVIAGHGEDSIVVYGLLQWLSLALLIGWGVLEATANRWAAGAAALAAVSDAKLIYESLADLRPDIPLALLAVGSLCFFIHFLKRRSALSFSASAFLIVLLPLVHATGVLPAATLLTALIVAALIPVAGRVSKPLLIACASLAVATIAVFLLRKPIMNVLIPSHVPVADQLTGRHDMSALLLGLARRGIAWKLRAEGGRWVSYFLPGNLPQLVFLLTGFFALLRAAWQRRLEWPHWLWLPIGWIAGVLLLTVTDPHFTSTHLISLIALGYVMAGLGWARLLDEARPAALRRHAVLALAVLAFLGFGLRAAQAAYDVSQGIHQGVSRASVRRLLAKAFPGTGVTWAVGPTSIWLYVPSGGRPVIVDDRSDPGIIRTALWQRMSVLVLDTDFLHYGWGKIAREGVAEGWLRPIGEVGQPRDRYWLEAFRIEH
jgi:hypothetical protein